MSEAVPEYVQVLQDNRSSHQRIPCPLCGSERLASLYEGVALRGNDLVLSMCQKCSHMFVNPRPSIEVFEDFYHGDNYFHLCAEFSRMSLEDKMKQFDSAEFWKERGSHGQRLYEKYLNGRLSASDTVFDFGCGDGGWLWGLQQATGCAVDGEEISDVYVRVASQRLGIPIFAGPIEKTADAIIEKHRGKIRLVIVSGSLQHMLDPVLCLRAAREILVDDGLLYVCNWSIFEHYMAAYEDQARRLLGEILSWEHLHYFHETTLKFMIQAAGFEVLDFALESSVRPRHMEALARKTDQPAALPNADKVASIEMRIRAFESATLFQRLRSP